MKKISFSPAVIAGLVIVGLLAVFVIANVVGANARGARHENGIEATQENNRNILGQYSAAVAEQAQIPAMARDDLTVVMESAFEGRYGENGSGAVFQWINENYPGSQDPELYRAIQRTISSGRADFRHNQTVLLDKKRAYETDLDYTFRGFWLGVAGYPKIDLDDITIVSSDSANQAFATGVDNGLTIRPETASEPR